jgi:UDP-N-acetylglucosamine transferase subunit ALG13
MIFVTVGSSQFPFDRLLRAVDRLATVDELVVQHGPSTVRPRGAQCFEFLPFDEVVAHVQRARAVVCHGGIGSVLLALWAGKRPLAVPRRARFAETTDDHQVETVRRLGSAGLVTAVLEPSHLVSALRGASGSEALPPAGNGRLVGDLHDYIRAAVDRASAEAAP